MARARKRGRKKKSNPGWFAKGHDARRHIFTPQDCRIGWWVANIRHPELREWLRMRLYVYYGPKRKEQPNGQAQNGRVGPAGGSPAGRDQRTADDGSPGGTGPAPGNDDIPF